MRHLRIWAALGFVFACSDVLQADHHHGDQIGRLLVADGEEGVLKVVELESGEVIEEFEIEGAFARVYTTESGRVAAAVQYGANRVDFVDSGLYFEDHGDHFDRARGRPSLLSFSLEGETVDGTNPVHFVSHADRVSVHFDGDSTAGIPTRNVIFQEEDLFVDTPSTLVLSSAPQHGLAVPVDGNRIVFSAPDPEREFGSLPSGFVVLDEDAQELQNFNNRSDFDASCLGMHGEALVGRSLLFGCYQRREDGSGDGGILVLTQDPETDDFEARKISYADGRRTSILRGHHDQPFAVGQYGRFPDPGYRALVRIHPDAPEILPEHIQELPTLYRSFDFEKAEGDLLAVLTIDGFLHVFRPADWTSVGSLQVTVDFTEAEEPRPFMETGPGVAYVTIPATGDVVEVDLETVTVRRTMQVGGSPTTLTYLDWVAPIGPPPSGEPGHADDATIGFTVCVDAGNRLGVEFDEDEVFELPEVDGVLVGWVGDEPGFNTLEEDEPEEGFFALESGANVILEVVSVSPGFKAHTPGFADILDAAGDRWDLGEAPFDTHPDWHIDPAAPGFNGRRLVWRFTVRLLDTGTTAYLPSEEFTILFTNGDCHEIDCSVARLLPGDLNVDSNVDLSDALGLLGVLFLGQGALPCAEGDPEHAGNVDLIDWNADRLVDISDAVGLLNWSFLGGPPHALGSSCQSFVACPSACSSD